MSVVQTNALTHMILGADNQPAVWLRTEHDAIQALAKQIFTVLRAGGHLIMLEEPPRLNRADLDCETAENQELIAAFDQEMHTILQQTGFANIHINEAWEIPGVDHFFDPTRQFADYSHNPAPRLRMISAHKLTPR